MISIIIPTLNEEKIIGQTLQALTSKLTIPYEIIVSDGNSTDATVAIAQKYASRVVTYSDAKRQTIAQGRNAGAAVAHGEYLVFMDADCSFEDPDAFLLSALKRFAKELDLVALIPKQRILPENERWVDRFWFGYINSYFRCMNNLFHVGQAGGELQMMRAEAFKKVGGFQENLVAAEDMNLFYRLSRIGRTTLDPNLTIFHTGRRIRQIGWTMLLWEWFANSFSVLIWNRAQSKVWVPIR